MSDILVRIKRAVLAGHYVFSEKARLEKGRLVFKAGVETYYFLISSKRSW